MEALRRMMETYGVGIGDDVVKVDMFLNHRIDTKLLFEMGEAWAEEFRAEKPDLVLTVEASGIAMAVAAAHALGHPGGVRQEEQHRGAQPGYGAGAGVFLHPQDAEHHPH